MARRILIWDIDTPLTGAGGRGPGERRTAGAPLETVPNSTKYIPISQETWRSETPHDVLTHSFYMMR